MPAKTATKTKMLIMALPMTTSGCRAVAERLGGIATVSGSIARRGLRGMIRLESGLPGFGDTAPALFVTRSAPDAADRLAGAGFGAAAGAVGATAAAGPRSASAIERDGVAFTPGGWAGVAPLVARAAATLGAVADRGTPARAGCAVGWSVARLADGCGFGAGLSPPGGASDAVTATYPHWQTASSA
jgi:hypothetical protein